MHVISWNLPDGSAPPATNVNQQRVWTHMRDGLHTDFILAQGAAVC